MRDIFPEQLRGVKFAEQQHSLHFPIDFCDDLLYNMNIHVIVHVIDNLKILRTILSTFFRRRHQSL